MPNLLKNCSISEKSKFHGYFEKENLFWIKKFISKRWKVPFEKEKQKEVKSSKEFWKSNFVFKEQICHDFLGKKKFKEKTTDFMNIFQKKISWIFEKFSLNEKAHEFLGNV